MNETVLGVKNEKEWSQFLNVMHVPIDAVGQPLFFIKFKYLIFFFFLVIVSLIFMKFKDWAFWLMNQN